MYTRVHTPNSPLLPLSPMPSSKFLSPYITSLGSRRSFTPNHLNILPPPSLSPIRGGKSSIKRKSCDLHDDPKTSESKFKRPLPVPVQSSEQKSMKKVRSSVRLIWFIWLFFSQCNTAHAAAFPFSAGCIHAFFNYFFRFPFSTIYHSNTQKSWSSKFTCSHPIRFDSSFIVCCGQSTDWSSANEPECVAHRLCTSENATAKIFDVHDTTTVHSNTFECW